MEKGLVSIITPCYNTAVLIPRLLDSILSQDYSQLEMILVDDGSKDNTLEVLDSYRDRFKARNIPYTVIHQENSGQSVAINNALKIVKGEFLLWPDSDDFYNRSDAVSLFVNTFRKLSSDYGMVKTLPRFVEENSLKEIKSDFITDKSERQFEQALFDRNFIWPPGLYMIAVSALDAVNPQREIYTHKKAGQNWQMVLPVLYSYKCYTLEENVFSILVRKNSHSRTAGWNSVMPQIEINSIYENTILQSLDRINEMPQAVKEQYKKAIRSKYARQKFFISCAFADKGLARKYKKEINDLEESLTIKEFIKYYLLKMNLYPFPKSR